MFTLSYLLGLIPSISQLGILQVCKYVVIQLRQADT